jgi:hypothetical protein
VRDSVDHRACGYTASPAKSPMPMQDIVGKRLSKPEKLVEGSGVHPSMHPKVPQPSRPRNPVKCRKAQPYIA